MGILIPEQRLEGPPPAGGERRDAQHTLELLARMMGGVEQRIDLGHGHSLRSSADREDRVARADLSLLQDAEIEAGPPAGGQERGHLRLVHPDSDAVASGPGLRDLEHGRANPVAIADADLVVHQPLDGEVLAELPVRELAAAQPLLPVAVRLDLVDEDRSLLSPVAAEIALPVALEVEPADA